MDGTRQFRQCQEGFLTGNAGKYNLRKAERAQVLRQRFDGVQRSGCVRTDHVREGDRGTDLHPVR